MNPILSREWQTLRQASAIFLNEVGWGGFTILAALLLVGCVASTPTVPGGHFWPQAGIGGYCKGDESLKVGIEAANQAIRQRGAAWQEHREEAAGTQDLRDKAQCIFAAHAQRGEPEGMYLYALTLNRAAYISSSDKPGEFRRPPNVEQELARLLKQAARQGHGPAFLLSLQVESVRASGLGQWIREAAEAGNVEAQVELGTAHLDRPPKYGLPHDAVEGEKWLGRAAERGHTIAISILANLYEQGAPGVEADKRKALRLLESIRDKPAMRGENYVIDPQDAVFALQLAGLYCAVGEKDKALPMYKRGYNVGDAEARQIMAHKCP